MNNLVIEKYESSPCAPGVYLMKDIKGKVIYVGKASNLKKRLASYIVRKTGHDLKTSFLLKKLCDFDVIITSTEHEALILESNLIKKFKPKYNVILKDGKNYPCIRLNIGHDYPTLQVVRSIKNDGALYFGPYSSAFSVRKTLKEVNRIFKLRKCRDNQMKNRTRPCLQYQIKACLGPCCNNVPKETYKKIVDNVKLFLKGRAPELMKGLKQEMMEAADTQEFETAAQIRDTVFAIEKTLERQVAVSADLMDRDVIACTGRKGRAVVTLLSVRSGYVVGTSHYPFDMTYNDIAEILAAFVKQYYEKNIFMPPQILLSEKIDDMELLESALAQIKGRKVTILVPERGEKKRIVEMALRNAENELSSIFSKESESRQTLEMLQKLMGMSNYPRRIECFDNSNMAGTDPVSSMVVFKNGVADKSSYKKFILKNLPEQDDYAYMTEVLTRRFSNKDVKTGEGDMALPDLLLVDGGKGQLSMAVSVLQSLGLEGKLHVAGLAKKDAARGESHDKIYIPGRANPLNTSQSLKALFLLQQLRDEAHRVAITFQRQRRIKRVKTSVLDGIPGIGKKRKQILMTHFKGITGMKKASIEEMASLPGMSVSAAESVFKALKEG